MNKFKTYIVIATAMLLWTACSHDYHNQKAEKTLSIDLSTAQPLMQNIMGLKAVRLNDSIAEHFPGSVSKFYAERDTLYILDSFKDQGLYRYNGDHHLAAGYSKRGQGPDEFLSAKDFALNSDGITMIDGYHPEGKLIHLDRNCNFISSETLDFRPDHLYYDKKGGVWFDNGNNTFGDVSDKLVYMKDGKKKSVLSIPDEIADVTFAPPYVFAEYSADTILYLPPVENIIYKCADGRAIPWIQLDFNGKWPEFDNKEKHEHPMELVKRIAENGLVNFVNIFTDKDDLLVNFTAGEYNYLYLTDYAGTYQKVYSYPKEFKEKVGTPNAYTDGRIVFAKPGSIVSIIPKL